MSAYTLWCEQHADVAPDPWALRTYSDRPQRYAAYNAQQMRRGVVLAAGSFAYNDAMMAQYAPKLVGRPAASIGQHDGQAIRMAQALGAGRLHLRLGLWLPGLQRRRGLGLGLGEVDGRLDHRRGGQGHQSARLIDPDV